MFALAEAEGVSVIASLALIAWAGGLMFMDCRWRRLPNPLLLSGVFLGLAHWAAYGVMPFGATVLEGVVAASLGMAMLLPFYKAGWMGAGDVKFCAVIGWLGGVKVLLVTLLIGSMVAGLMAILSLLVPSLWPLASSSGVESRLKSRIPFGAGLALALIALAADLLILSEFHF